MNEINFETFCSYMLKVKNFCSSEYRAGYQYGLRRFYHGKNFGENEHIELLKKKGGKIAEGLLDGLKGEAPKFKPEDFIVRKKVDLTTDDLSKLYNLLVKSYREKINGGLWASLDDFDIDETLNVFCPAMATATIEVILKYLREKK